MTVPLDVFQNSFNQAQDANVQAANMAGAMVAMGRYEQEFTVYGTAFWRAGQRYYLISGEADKVYDFMHREIDLLTTPVISWTQSLLVPSGCADEVGQAVRRALARQMAEAYPAAYFALAQKLSAFMPNDLAQPLLSEMQDELEGLYDSEQLALIAGLLRFAQRRGNVTALTGQRFQHWLKRQKQEMAGDAVPKDRFCQTFYGFAYQTSDGQWAYYANAVKNAAYRRLLTMQEKGCLTSTLVAKNCWYNYAYHLRDARADFLTHLTALFDQTYQKRLKTLVDLPPAVDQQAFAQALAYAQKQLPPASVQALRQCGRDWGVKMAEQI